MFNSIIQAENARRQKEVSKLRKQIAEKWDANKLKCGEARFMIRLPDPTKVDCALPANTLAKARFIVFVRMTRLKCVESSALTVFYHFLYRLCMKLVSPTLL